MGTKTNTVQPDEVDTPVANLLSGLMGSAVTQRTRMGQKEHRVASGQIVTRTLLDAITNFNKR